MKEKKTLSEQDVFFIKNEELRLELESRLVEIVKLEGIIDDLKEEKKELENNKTESKEFFNSFKKLNDSDLINLKNKLLESSNLTTLKALKEFIESKNYNIVVNMANKVNKDGITELLAFKSGFLNMSEIFLSLINEIILMKEKSDLMKDRVNVKTMEGTDKLKY